MRIKNLTNAPIELGDGQMIGAAGTSSDERDYGLDELSERDQKRFERGQLEVSKSLPEDAETIDTAPGEGINLSPLDGNETTEAANRKPLAEGEVFLDNSEREEMPLVGVEGNLSSVLGKPIEGENLSAPATIPTKKNKGGRQ